MKEKRESFFITYFNKKELGIKAHCDVYLKIKRDILKVLKNYEIDFVLADTELCINYQQELSIANDKLKKIEEYIYNHQLFGMRYGKTLYRESLINIVKIIKGDEEK